MIGQKFNRLTVVSEAGRIRSEKGWRCLCDCGNFVELPGYAIRSGGTKSCGCLQKERTGTVNRKHGKFGSRTYSSWAGMIQRSLNPSNKQYSRYGAKGITVCDRWRKFENFLEDMGERPEGTTLDRVDNARGYEPGNCRWANPQQQASNRKFCHQITYQGKTQTIAEWARESGIPRTNLYRWVLVKGMTLTQAVNH